MRRKTIILITILFFLGAFAFYFFYSKGNSVNLTTIKNFLPFGQNPTGTIPDTNNTPGIPAATTTPVAENPAVTTSDSAEIGRLREISSNPVAGYTVFTRGKQTVIRYIERGTGNVFETNTTTLDTARLTNTTFPRIQEAFFTNSGNSVIIRTLGSADLIKTYLANITTSKASSSVAVGTLQGSYIDDNISFVAVSPLTTSIFVLNEDQGGATGFTATSKATGIKNIFASKLGEWLPQWYNKASIALTTKASAGVPGDLELLNTATGAENPVLLNIAGLTTLVNPSGLQILYSTSPSNGGLTLNIMKKGAQAHSVTTPTLPEKCAWSATEKTGVYCLVPSQMPFTTYPDAWYQGLVSFSDNVWKIAPTGSSTLIYSATQDNISFDGIRPSLSTDEKYIFFMNKTDGTLWSYQLNN